jgi:hypothetical protein
MTYEQVKQIKATVKGNAQVTLQCNRWLRFTSYLNDPNCPDKQRYIAQIEKAERQLNRLLGNVVEEEEVGQVFEVIKYLEEEAQIIQSCVDDGAHETDGELLHSFKTVIQFLKDCT